MSTIPQEVLYYINPVNAPVVPIPENGQIVVTEARDRQPDKLGEVIKVTGVWHDDLRLWYRGEDGNYYDGPMLGQNVSNSQYGIDIVGDVAVLGYVNNSFAVVEGGRGHSLSYASRWDGQQIMINGSLVREHYALNLVNVAPWASELWPAPTDDDDLRAAKIALAKHRWETRQKHLGIIREGQRRDWLYILESHDFLSAHGMKRPVYGALVTGNVILPTSQSIRVDELSSRSQSHLTALSRFRNNDANVFSAQVQVPVQFVYSGNHPYREGTNIHTVDSHNLTAQFQMASNNYEVTVNAQSVQPTITALSS